MQNRRELTSTLREGTIWAWYLCTPESTSTRILNYEFAKLKESAHVVSYLLSNVKLSKLEKEPLSVKRKTIHKLVLGKNFLIKVWLNCQQWRGNK